MNSENEVIKIRNKIFKSDKYKKYEETLDKMMIPENFDIKNCIPQIFNDSKYSQINRYDFGEYKELYQSIKKDIPNLEIKGKPILVVHPFYPILRHANFLVESKTYLNKYLEYEKRIIKLLKESKNDIILFESPDSFARYTYSFLKYKRIKKVILTEHSHGRILDKNDLNDLVFHKAMIAGCYNNHCIKEILDELTDYEIEKLDDLIMERYC